MKRLPRVPVWLILLPLVALAFTAWFGPAATHRFATAREAYAAAPAPGPAPSAKPTSSAQPTPACPPPGPHSEGRKEWKDLPWGGLWFDLADLEYTAVQDCGPHGHGPPPWSHGWGHGHHGRFQPSYH